MTQFLDFEGTKILANKINELSDSSCPTVNATGLNEYIGSSSMIKSLKKGTKLTLFIDTDSTGNCALNLNSYGIKNIKDSSQKIVTNLKKDIPYNLCYNGTDFILQTKGGDSSGGNATPDKLLEGYKATVDSGQIVGTMKNVNATIQNSADSDAFTNNCITGVASNSYVTGFDMGVTGYVSNPRIHIANLLAQNIKAGVKVGGQNGYITGTFTNDATAQAGHILSGQSAYVKGSKINGNMANLTASSTITHETNNATKVVKADGLFVGNNTDGVRRVSLRYNGGGGYITGNTLFGLPESTVASSLGVTANKIVSGNTVCGVAGNATALRRVTGTVNVAYNATTQVNLGFNPTVLIVRYDSKTKSGDAKWHYRVFSPTLSFTCWKDKSYSDASVTWDNPSDPRTSTGFTATGEYYNNNSTWTYEALLF